MKFDHLGDVAPVLLLDIAAGEKALVPVDRVRYRDPTVGVDRVRLVLENPTPGAVRGIWQYLEALEGPGTATVSIGRIGELRVTTLAPGEVTYLHDGAILGRDARTRVRLVILGSYKVPGDPLPQYLLATEISGPGPVAFQTHGNVLSFTLQPGERLRAPPSSLVSLTRGTPLQVQVYGGPPHFPKMYYFPLVEIAGPGTVLLHSGFFELGGAT